ncbi:MAG TPA: type I methionyl aminopeptidase [Thermoanaerobaculia bacterium]|nr:type I methionyl aminopeptidase [Thermoanaerobaculia bacterium]
MPIETTADLEALTAAGRVAWKALDAMVAAVRPGISTAELNEIGAREIRRLGARAAPMIDAGFPAECCISVNDAIAHGVPGPYVLTARDLVNIDVSVELHGFYADNGASVAVGNHDAEMARLCDAGRRTLASALAAVRAGDLLNRIGLAAERTASASGFEVIRELCGHGVGRSLHEYPGQVCSFYEPSDRRVMTEGMVLAIEPFVSTGARGVRRAADGWTLSTDDGGLAVQYEHTVVVTRAGALVVTAPEPYTL